MLTKKCYKIQISSKITDLDGYLRLCEGPFLDNTQAQVETKILDPLFVVWWTELSSLQLNEG